MATGGSTAAVAYWAPPWLAWSDLSLDQQAAALPDAYTEAGQVWAASSRSSRPSRFSSSRTPLGPSI